MPLDPRSVTPDGRDDTAPCWRKHFPIDTSQEKTSSRREFIGGVSVAGGAIACSQAALNHFSPAPHQSAQKASTAEPNPENWPRLKLDRNRSTLEPGEAMLFHYPDEKSPCLLIKLTDGDLVAFAQKCTHLACPVVPEPTKNTFHCPCHHGEFDLRTGQPIAGPPQSSLPKVQLEFADDGEITATGFAS